INNIYILHRPISFIGCCVGDFFYQLKAFDYLAKNSILPVKMWGTTQFFINFELLFGIGLPSFFLKARHVFFVILTSYHYVKLRTGGSSFWIACIRLTGCCQSAFLMNKFMIDLCSNGIARPAMPQYCIAFCIF